LYREFEELRVVIFAPELKPAMVISVAVMARRVKQMR